VVLLIIVVTLLADGPRPSGGSYIVSKDNLARSCWSPSLLVDYILTVAVSVAGGTLAIGQRSIHNR
jgi:hypothetical protein